MWKLWLPLTSICLAGLSVHHFNVFSSFKFDHNQQEMKIRSGPVLCALNRELGRGGSVESFEDPVLQKAWAALKAHEADSGSIVHLPVGCHCCVDGTVAVLNRNLLWVRVPHKYALLWILVGSHSSFWHLIKDSNISHKVPPCNDGAQWRYVSALHFSLCPFFSYACAVIYWRRPFTANEWM